jgi:hypothetical protein
MFTHPHLASGLARDRQRDMLAQAAQQRQVAPAPRPRQGVSVRRTGQQADDPFPQAQPPGGASLMNHTVAASSHPRKGDPPWPP